MVSRRERPFRSKAINRAVSARATESPRADARDSVGVPRGISRRAGFAATSLSAGTSLARESST